MSRSISESFWVFFVAESGESWGAGRHADAPVVAGGGVARAVGDVPRSGCLGSVQAAGIIVLPAHAGA